MQLSPLRGHRAFYQPGHATDSTSLPFVQGNMTFNDILDASCVGEMRAQHIGTLMKKKTVRVF